MSGYAALYAMATVDGLIIDAGTGTSRTRLLMLADTLAILFWER